MWICHKLTKYSSPVTNNRRRRDCVSLPNNIMEMALKGNLCLVCFLVPQVDYQLPCEQALLGVEGARGKEERACNDVSGVFISASKKSMQNADWWILNLVLTSLLFACIVLRIQKWWKAEFLFVRVVRISRNNLGFLWN